MRKEKIDTFKISDKKFFTRCNSETSICIEFAIQIVIIFNKGLSIDIKNNRKFMYRENIAGRLPENSRNRFVYRQSKKTVKRTDQKKIDLFIEG